MKLCPLFNHNFIGNSESELKTKKKMGILCYMSSATNTYRSFCSYGCSTFASIGAAVRINVNNLVFRRVPVPGGVRANDNDIGDSATQKTLDRMLPAENDSIPVNATNMGIEDSVMLKNPDLMLPVENDSILINANNMGIEDSVMLQTPDLMLPMENDSIPINANNMGIEDSVMPKTPDLMLPVENDSIPVNANNTGIEDSVMLKNPNAETNSPVKDKVGVWGHISLAIRSVKQKIVDFCKWSCKYGWFAVKEVDNAVDNANNTGIEDSVMLKNPNAETNSPVKDKVGVWGHISSAIRDVKQKIVDFCKWSCKYWWFAVKEVDNAVRLDGVGKLKSYVQDNETLSYIAEVVIEIAKDAVYVAIMKKVRRVPGGIRAYQIILQSLHRHGSQLFSSSQPVQGGKEVVKLKKEIEELHGKIETLEKEGCGCSCNCRKLHDQTEFPKQDLDSTSNTIR